MNGYSLFMGGVTATGAAAGAAAGLALSSHFEWDGAAQYASVAGGAAVGGAAGFTASCYVTPILAAKIVAKKIEKELKSSAATAAE